MSPLLAGGLTCAADGPSIVAKRQESSAATRPAARRQMREILRTNDPVLLSFAEALLADARIPFDVLDRHAAAVDGSILAVARRVVVDDADAAAASALLDGAGVPGA
jgi:hypothetical protein